MILSTAFMKRKSFIGVYQEFQHKICSEKTFAETYSYFHSNIVFGVKVFTQCQSVKVSKYLHSIMSRCQQGVKVFTQYHGMSFSLIIRCDRKIPCGFVIE